MWEGLKTVSARINDGVDLPISCSFRTTMIK